LRTKTAGRPRAIAVSEYLPNQVWLDQSAFWSDIDLDLDLDLSKMIDYAVELSFRCYSWVLFL